MIPRTSLPVRARAGAPLHIARPTGRGYRTACGRSLAGPRLEVPRAPWSRAWRLELVCAVCDRRQAQCRTEDELARLAGWPRR